MEAAERTRMKAYVINLDRSPDRLAHMRSEFDRVGVPFERFAATDARDLGDADIKAVTGGDPAGWDANWLSGEVAIFMSHLGIWRQIAAGDAHAAAIFEDDVHFAEDIAPLLASDAWIPRDADIVRLESHTKLKLRGGHSIGVAPERRLYRVASGTRGAGGYVMTKRAAARLIEVAPKMRCAADNFLFKPSRSAAAGSLSRWQVVPGVCIHDQFLEPGRQRFPSLVGEAERQPSVAGARSLLHRLMPWRKQFVPFRP